MAFARVVHVLAVVVWIGGLSMVTTVLLPAIRHGSLGADKVLSFQMIERRFVWQARSAIILVGLSGFYMVAQAHLWDRFATVQFWWMHAMVCLWLIFAILLFIVEPFLLHRHVERWSEREPELLLAWLGRMHWILLGLSTVTVLGAVAGSHGWSII